MGEGGWGISDYVNSTELQYCSKNLKLKQFFKQQRLTSGCNISGNFCHYSFYVIVFKPGRKCWLKFQFKTNEREIIKLIRCKGAPVYFSLRVLSGVNYCRMTAGGGGWGADRLNC